jgi:hypothetical protein
VQEWQDATMNRYRISARTTFVMLREKCLWSVGGLQRVRISNLVFHQTIVVHFWIAFKAPSPNRSAWYFVIQLSIPAQQFNQLKS